MNKKMRAKISTTALAAGLILTGGLVAAPAAQADPPGCQTVLWGFLGSQLRSLCDKPIQSDGSWMRLRLIWVPAHHVPFTCHTYGGSYSSTTTCDGGYDVDERIVSQETYPVTPDTVLPDEPGWITR